MDFLEELLDIAVSEERSLTTDKAREVMSANVSIVVYLTRGEVRGGQAGEIFEGSFSAVSTTKFAIKAFLKALAEIYIL